MPAALSMFVNGTLRSLRGVTLPGLLLGVARGAGYVYLTLLGDPGLAEADRMAGENARLRAKNAELTSDRESLRQALVDAEARAAHAVAQGYQDRQHLKHPGGAQ